MQYSINIKLKDDVDLWINEHIYFTGEELEVFYAPLLNSEHYYYPTENENGKKVIDWIPKNTAILVLDKRYIN